MAEDPLNLQRLPTLDAPPGLWEDIAAGLEAEQDHQRSRFHWSGMAAAAAGLAALLMVAVLVDQKQVAVPTTRVEDNQLARVQAVSSALEARLGMWQGTVIDAASADALARLERELIWLDADIERNPQDTALWAERVALQSEMVEQYLSSDWRSEMMLTAY